MSKVNVPTTAQTRTKWVIRRIVFVMAQLLNGPELPVLRYATPRQTRSQPIGGRRHTGERASATYDDYAGFSAGGFVMGSKNSKIAPPVGALRAQIFPPWASIAERQIANPRPVPWFFVVK